MKVLCLVAHPDDESLFCGALLATHAINGDDVRVVSLGTGVGARGEIGEALTWAEAERAAAFRDACKALGVTGEILDVFPDQQSDAIPQLTINRAVEDLIHSHEPARVYTHHVGDLNIDHRRVAEAVFVATRRGPVVLCMTPEFPERCVGPAFEPTYTTIATVKAVEKKIAACLCYQTELREYPHPRSERALREKDSEAFMEIR